MLHESIELGSVIVLPLLRFVELRNLDVKDSNIDVVKSGRYVMMHAQTMAVAGSIWDQMYSEVRLSVVGNLLEVGTLKARPG